MNGSGTQPHESPAARLRWGVVALAALGSVALSGLAVGGDKQDQKLSTQSATRPVDATAQEAVEVLQQQDKRPPTVDRDRGAALQVPSAERALMPEAGLATPMRERRNLVNAAIESAVDELIRRVEAETIRDDLTVRQFLDSLSATSRRELRTHLRGASRQVGGPRFPATGLAEVQLEVDGREVQSKLMELANAAGAKSPASAKELARGLSHWRNRTFRGTGGSAAANVGRELRVRPEQLSDAWKYVSDEAKQNAFVQAHENAVEQYLEVARLLVVLPHVPGPDEPTAESTEVGDKGDAAAKPAHLTLDQVFSTDGIGQETRQWLHDRPLSRLRYNERRQVEVKLAVEPQEWVEQIRQSASRRDTDLPEIPEEKWQELVLQLSDRLENPEATEIVGIALAPETVERLPPLVLPRVPPDWTRAPIVASATAPLPEGNFPAAQWNRLRMAAHTSAVEQAIAELRTTIEALPVGDQMLGELASRHPAVRRLVDAALEQLQASDSTWRGDSVTVIVPLNPQALWQGLQRLSSPPPAAQAGQ